MGLDVTPTKGVFVTAEEFVHLITDDNRQAFVEWSKAYSGAKGLSECTDLESTRSLVVELIFDHIFDRDADWQGWLSEFHPNLPSLIEIGFIVGADIACVEVLDSYPYQEQFFVFSIEESLIETPTAAGQYLGEKTGAKITTSVAVTVN
jgi:hypothetical protein